MKEPLLGNCLGQLARPALARNFGALTAPDRPRGHSTGGHGLELTEQPSFTRIADVYRAVEQEASAPLVLPDGYKREATVGVLDIYQEQKGGPLLHGDKVASIIEAGGLSDSDIQRIEHRTANTSNKLLSDLLFQEAPESTGERLDAYIELSASHILAKTNGTLEQLLADPNYGFTTLNQSQGSSRIGVFQLLESAAVSKSEDEGEKLSEVGHRLARACGLEPEASDFSFQNLRQAFVDRVSEVVDNSDYIAGQQQRHIGLLEQARDRGTLVVTSGGNDADELWDYRARGLKIPDSFDDDVSKVGTKLVVGALDDRGTSDPYDDQIAFFSSLYSNVNLMAPGVNVPTDGGPATGTSYAAPLVAAEAEKIRRENPGWSVEQVELESKGRFTATDGFHLLR